MAKKIKKEPALTWTHVSQSWEKLPTKSFIKKLFGLESYKVTLYLNAEKVLESIVDSKDGTLSCWLAESYRQMLIDDITKWSRLLKNVELVELHKETRGLLK